MANFDAPCVFHVERITITPLLRAEEPTSAINSTLKITFYGDGASCTMTAHTREMQAPRDSILIEIHPDLKWRPMESTTEPST